MKTKHYFLLALGWLTAFLVGLLIGNDRTEAPSGNVMETRETTVDTLSYHAPMPQSELASGTRRYTLPVYRFIGGGYGGEPRQRRDSDSLSFGSITSHYGNGAGGEPQCKKDSAIVGLPIIQRHYADSTYEAWVSGPVDPRLDSLRVFASTSIITKREWKPPKRWHIGPTVGFGFTPHGFEPFIGVSVTYSLIEL